MSDYFTYTNLTPNTVARAADVNTRFQAVSAGFDMIPPPQYLRDDRLTYSVAGGTANAIIANPTVPILAYNDGLHLVVKATAANTGAVTINVSSLGVKSVLRADGSALQAGDIVVGQILDLTYDGTNFRLSMAFADLSPAGVVAKLQAAGSFSLSGGQVLTVPGGIVTASITVNGQALTPSAFGASLLNTASDVTARTLLNLGTMATQTAANYALLNSPALIGTPTAPTASGGTNTTQIATTAFVTSAVAAASLGDGDKGDITLTSGGTVWTIDNGVVTLAKMANMATGSLIYRRTAGTGVPEVQTLATLKTDLGLTGTNSGDQTITLTGDVGGSGTGSFAVTLTNNVVTYAKMQDASVGNVVLARASSTSGDWQELSIAATRLVGRGATGDIAAISLDGTMAWTGTTFGVASNVALAGSPTTTTQAWGTSNTTVATTAFVDRLRGLSSTSGAGKTLGVSDRGGMYKSTGAVTIPSATFAADDVVVVYNDSGANISLTQGSGLTLRQTGTANTGTRTLLQRGFATITFISASEAVVGGDII